MYSKKPYMIPVNPHLSSKESNEQVVGKHVTPMTAVEERAKVEMKEVIKENVPHVPEKTIKTQMRRHTVKFKPTLKKKTPQKQLKRKQESGPSIFTPDQKRIKLKLGWPFCATRSQTSDFRQNYPYSPFHPTK